MKSKRKIIVYIARVGTGEGVREASARHAGKQIWMMGGAGRIASFLDAGEIDAFDIHVIPVFIGKGIPMVAPRHRDIPLRLRSSRKYADGVVRLQYEIAR